MPLSSPASSDSDGEGGEESGMGASVVLPGARRRQRRRLGEEEGTGVNPNATPTKEGPAKVCVRPTEDFTIQPPVSELMK